MKSLALLLLALFASISSFAQPAKPAEEFALGIWYEGGVGDARQNVLPVDPEAAAKIYEHDFKDIAAHGIKIVVVPNTPPNHHKVLLDAAEHNHLKLIIEVGLDGGEFGGMIRGSRPVDKDLIKKVFDEVIKPILDHPALMRIQLLDEPAPDAFGRYKQVADAVKELMPNMPVFCCLPGAASADEFIKQTGSKLVAFDTYTLGVNTPEGDVNAMVQYANDARKSALAAKKAGATSWAVIQCHSITSGLRYPTAPEIRCEAYLSLATGNKGVYWFLYQSEALDAKHTVMMRGLVNEKGTSDERWEEVTKLTDEISKIGPVLMDLTLSDEAPTRDEDVAIYKMQDSKGVPYLFAVNMNTQKAQRAHLKYDASAGKTVAKVIALPAHTEIPADTDGNAKWEDNLAPGSGALFRIETK